MRFLRSGDRQSIVAAGTPAEAWTFTLTADHPCFAGHFDGDPILPGVVHLALALEACTLLNRDLPPLVGVEDVRFVHPVRPGDLCRVAICAMPDGAWRRFELHCLNEPASRGVLVFSGPWTAQ